MSDELWVMGDDCDGKEGNFLVEIEWKRTKKRWVMRGRKERGWVMIGEF